eukprot:2525561-Ditylum_brightwellii.AAC.1
MQFQIEAAMKSLSPHTISKKWATEYVKGYQKGPNLSRQAVLNNVADCLATETRESLPWNRHHRPCPLPLTPS